MGHPDGKRSGTDGSICKICGKGPNWPFNFHSTTKVVGNSQGEDKPSPLLWTAFTSRFFIKRPPEAHELWTWWSSFLESKPSLATVQARNDPPPVHHR